MKVKFKLETYDAENPSCKIGICSGTADDKDIGRALEYLLQLKEERFIDGQRNIDSDEKHSFYCDSDICNYSITKDLVGQEPAAMYCGYCNSLPCDCPQIPMPTSNAVPVLPENQVDLYGTAIGEKL